MQLTKIALFRLAFAAPTPTGLSLLVYTKSLTHYTKGTPSGVAALRLLVGNPVSGSISLPLSGCFSPFPHGTCSLSVMHEYLGLESGLPMFRQDFTCPALLKDNECSTSTGLSPILARLSNLFDFIPHCHWPGPRSLATTCGVSVDVLSCRYLVFQFPAFASYPYVFESKIPYLDIWKPLLSSRPKACGRRGA